MTTKVFYSLSGLLLTLTLALILEGALMLPLLFSWMVAINAISLLFYGVDKLNSQTEIGRKARIPETTLLILALAGGTPVAMLSMALLRHKVSDTWFMVRFLLIFALQGTLIVLLWDQIPWPAGTPVS